MDEPGEQETAAIVADERPPDLAEAVSSLATLDDASLWDAARSHLPVEAAEQLEQLHFKRQREGFTAAEAEEAATLVQRYERVMLVRARATAMLKERGHDISVLAPRSFRPSSERSPSAGPPGTEEK